jgi:hypothetical protein
MLTTQERLEELLLDGRKVNKFSFLQETGSVCLAQRILDIRQTKNWNIRSKAIKGKGALREYWLEPSEIKRIKAQIGTYKQLTEDNKNTAETSQKAPLRSELTPNGVKIERVEDEQIGIGLPWQ